MAIDLSEKSHMTGPHGSPRSAATGVSFVLNLTPALTHETRWATS
jgi:hypothetical protein